MTTTLTIKHELHYVDGERLRPGDRVEVLSRVACRDRSGDSKRWYVRTQAGRIVAVRQEDVADEGEG